MFVKIASCSLSSDVNSPKAVYVVKQIRWNCRKKLCWSTRFVCKCQVAETFWRTIGYYFRIHHSFITFLLKMIFPRIFFALQCSTCICTNLQPFVHPHISFYLALNRHAHSSFFEEQVLLTDIWPDVQYLYSAKFYQTSSQMIGKPLDTCIIQQIHVHNVKYAIK